MKVKELISKLSQTNGDNIVYLATEKSIWEFSGVSFDDVGDVELAVCSGDKEA